MDEIQKLVIKKYRDRAKAELCRLIEKNMRIERKREPECWMLKYNGQQILTGNGKGHWTKRGYAQSALTGSIKDRFKYGLFFNDVDYCLRDSIYKDALAELIVDGVLEIKEVK